MPAESVPAPVRPDRPRSISTAAGLVAAGSLPWLSFGVLGTMPFGLLGFAFLVLSAVLGLCVYLGLPAVRPIASVLVPLSCALLAVLVVGSLGSLGAGMPGLAWALLVPGLLVAVAGLVGSAAGLSLLYRPGASAYLAGVRAHRAAVRRQRR